jgi:uncharacterized protein (DUF849 family)
MTAGAFITCALTGAGDTAGRSPHVPVTPAEIAESGLAAAAAGASVLHIHVRDPRTGGPSRSLDLYREVVARIRDRNDSVILNLTGGMGGDMVFGPDAPFPLQPGSDFVPAEERIEHILELKPEICSLDCGSLNFGDMVYATTPTWLRKMAGLIAEAGVKPELEVFEIGHLLMARQLIDEGLVAAPPLFQLCLGIRWAADASPATMAHLVGMLPPGALWAGFGIGAAQFRMAAQALLLGGNMRVGLEDNLMLRRGEFATNAQLVERAVAIAGTLDIQVLGPDDTRKLLGLTIPRPAGRN